MNEPQEGAQTPAAVAAEEWRAIKGLEGRYEVSDQGRVRSLDRTIVNAGDQFRGPYTRRFKGKVLSQAYANPYFAVYLPPYRQARVHALVLETFVGPCPPGMVTRHLNGNHTDNRLVNLAYGTQSENMRDKVRHGMDHNASKTHCKQKHEFTPENTYQYVNKNGHNIRRCKTCQATATHLQHLKNKAAKPVKAPEPFPHGTRRGYLRPCRCDACRAANTAYARELARRSA